MLLAGLYPLLKSRAAFRDTKDPKRSRDKALQKPDVSVPSADANSGPMEGMTAIPDADNAKAYEPVFGSQGLLTGSSFPISSNRYADLVTPGFVMALRFPMGCVPKGRHSFLELHWARAGVRDEATTIPDPGILTFGIGMKIEKSVGKYLRISRGLIQGFDEVHLRGHLVTRRVIGETDEWEGTLSSSALSLSPLLGLSLAKGGWKLGLESRLEMALLGDSLDGAHGMLNGMVLFSVSTAGDPLYRAPKDTKPKAP